MPQHKCPLTEIELSRQCPVSTCMWNTSSLGSGCLHSNASKHVDYLAKAKGVEEPKQEIEKAVERISCLVALDKYAEFLNTMPTMRFVGLSKSELKLLRSVAADDRFNVRQWSLEKILTAFSTIPWRKFENTLEKELQHRKVLGVTRLTYSRIRDIVRLRKAVAGKGTNQIIERETQNG